MIVIYDPDWVPYTQAEFSGQALREAVEKFGGKLPKNAQRGVWGDMKRQGFHLVTHLSDAELRLCESMQSGALHPTHGDRSQYRMNTDSADPANG